MEAMECIRTRRSVRKYLEKEVGEKKIRAIIEAGMQAPSAHDEQPWHFIIVRDRETLERVSGFHQWIKMAKSAPLGILVCADPKLRRSEDEFWPLDMSAATQNVLLAAHALGIHMGMIFRNPRFRHCTDDAASGTTRDSPCRGTCCRCGKPTGSHHRSDTWNGHEAEARQ